MKTKTIKFNGILWDVDIRLRQGITILDGKSASGKTLLFNIIKNQVTLGELNNTLCIDDFTEDPSITEQKLKSIRNGFIIIDHADRIVSNNSNIIEHINNDLDNYYILIGRAILIYHGLESLAVPVIEGNKVSIRYKV